MLIFRVSVTKLRKKLIKPRLCPSEVTWIVAMAFPNLFMMWPTVLTIQESHSSSRYWPCSSLNHRLYFYRIQSPHHIWLYSMALATLYRLPWAPKFSQSCSNIVFPYILCLALLLRALTKSLMWVRQGESGERKPYKQDVSHGLTALSKTWLVPLEKCYSEHFCWFRVHDQTHLNFLGNKANA